MTVDDLEYQQWLKRDRIATCIQVAPTMIAAARAVDRILNKEPWPAGARTLARLFPSVING
jgi:hypothetical protein